MEFAAVCLHFKPKARKKHICDECHGSILPQEQYHVWQGIFDSYPFRFKICPDCEELRTQVNAGVRHFEERIAFNELCEHVFETNSLSLIKTFLQTKEKRKAKIMPWMWDRLDDLINADDDKQADVETA